MRFTSTNRADGLGRIFFGSPPQSDRPVGVRARWNAIADRAANTSHNRTHRGTIADFAVEAMFLSPWEPGYSPQFAGWRILPHVYLPESWNLPVRVGFVAEYSFQNTSGLSTAPAPRTGGTSNRRCCCVGNGACFHRRWSTTARSKVSSLNRISNPRCISCFSEGSGKLGIRSRRPGTRADPEELVRVALGQEAERP